ncbi:hypothetical protein AHP1_1151 [Aeromonas phage Ahp1_CNU-2021]|nr:hypothetical protein AHP1_1151 [Aeromonas phage Ahp1_CNU-2021]
MMGVIVNIFNKIRYAIDRRKFLISVKMDSSKASAIEHLQKDRAAVDRDLKILDDVISGEISRYAIRSGLCSVLEIVGLLYVKIYTNVGYKHFSGSNVYPIDGSIIWFYRESNCANLSTEFYERRVELARHWAIQVRKLLSDMDKYL